MGLGLLGKRKKAEEHPLEQSQRKIIDIIGRWKDECDFEYAYKIERVVGEDFINLDLMGIESVKLSDVCQLASVDHVTRFYCDLDKGSIAVKLEMRVGGLTTTSPSTYQNILPRDNEGLRSKLREAECSQDEINRAYGMVELYKKKALEKEHIFPDTEMNIVTKNYPGMLAVYLRGIHRIDSDVMMALNERDETVTSWIELENNILRFDVKKNKAMINLTAEGSL